MKDQVCRLALAAGLGEISKISDEISALSESGWDEISISGGRIS
jgi:hypothetical protein